MRDPPRTHLVITKFFGQNVVDGVFTNLRNLISQLPKRYSSILEENALNLRHDFVGHRWPPAPLLVVNVCASFGELPAPFADVLDADASFAINFFQLSMNFNRCKLLRV